MSKFKVGDRVVVRSDLKVDERYPQQGERVARCLVTSDMAKLAGKVVTIGESVYPDRYRVCGSARSWTDGMFEGLATNMKKIVVTTDGKTTTAKLFSGKDLAKSATAECSPSDEFVFETGAALALDRLLQREEKKEPKFTKADLKDGMFCRLGADSWFVIVGDLAVFEDGDFCYMHELQDDLTWSFAGDIEVVLEGPCCFNSIKCIPSTLWVKYIRPGAKY